VLASAQRKYNVPADALEQTQTDKSTAKLRRIRCVPDRKRHCTAANQLQSIEMQRDIQNPATLVNVYRPVYRHRPDDLNEWALKMQHFSKHGLGRNTEMRPAQSGMALKRAFDLSGPACRRNPIAPQ
jgi:hypothetical protein